jgi:hypothetical protein
MSSGSDPSGLLHLVEREWKGMLRRFVLMDIKAGRVGTGIEHSWDVDDSGLIVVIRFDLVIGNMTLSEIAGHGKRWGWDAADISDRMAIFLDSFVQNAEWICPFHMTGSRVREVSSDLSLERR